MKTYNPNKKREILVAFDNMIAGMVSNKKVNPITTGLFLRGRKLNISLVFITQTYFAVNENIRLKSTDSFVMKIPNKKGIQEISFNHLSDVDCQDFVNLEKKLYFKTIFLLVVDTPFTSDSFLHFRKNLLEGILKLIITIDDKIKYKKLKYLINREAATVSALSPGKIDKYE